MQCMNILARRMVSSLTVSCELRRQLKEKKWESVDNMGAARWPWFCGWHSCPFTYTDTNAGEHGQTLKRPTKLGLTPNTAKTQDEDPLQNSPILTEEVEAVTCLGSVVDTTRGTDADIKCRMNKARVVFNMFRKIWSSKYISIQHEAGDAVWTRDMENNKTHNKQAANIH